MKITTVVEFPSDTDQELVDRLTTELDQSAKITIEELFYPAEIPQGISIVTEKAA
jgi:hypothetical protein